MKKKNKDDDPLLETIPNRQTERRAIRYDTTDDLHWKTDRQAASLIHSTRSGKKLKGTKK